MLIRESIRSTWYLLSNVQKIQVERRIGAVSEEPQILRVLAVWAVSFATTGQRRPYMRTSLKARNRHVASQMSKSVWSRDCGSTIVSVVVLKWMFYQFFGEYSWELIRTLDKYFAHFFRVFSAAKFQDALDLRRKSFLVLVFPSHVWYVVWHERWKTSLPRMPSTQPITPSIMFHI